MWCLFWPWRFHFLLSAWCNVHVCSDITNTISSLHHQISRSYVWVFFWKGMKVHKAFEKWIPDKWIVFSCGVQGGGAPCYNQSHSCSGNSASATSQHWPLLFDILRCPKCIGYTNIHKEEVRCAHTQFQLLLLLSYSHASPKSSSAANIYDVNSTQGKQRNHCSGQ